MSSVPPNYPTGVVNYNQLRFLTAQSVDVGDKVTFAVQMPRDFTRFFFGAFSLLQDVNSWRASGVLTPDNMVDIANNEVVFMAICDAVADCINNDDAVRAALSGWSTSEEGYTPGQPPIDITAPINSPSYNPTCDEDILWAQCQQLVEFIYTKTVEALDDIEVASNATEIVDVVGNSIPFVAAAWDTLGADGVSDLVNYFQEAASESFDAQADSAYREDLACEIFCECRSDCVISSARISDIMAGRVSSYIASFPASLVDLMTTMAGLNWTSAIVADAVFYAAFAGFRIASVLIPLVYNRSFDELMRLAVDDANPDWQILCGTCTPNCNDYDFNTGQLGWFAVNTTSVVSTNVPRGRWDGDGFIRGQDTPPPALGADEIQFAILNPFGANLDTVEIFYENLAPDVGVPQMRVDSSSGGTNRTSGSNTIIPAGTGSFKYNVTVKDTYIVVIVVSTIQNNEEFLGKIKRVILCDDS